MVPGGPYGRHGSRLTAGQHAVDAHSRSDGGVMCQQTELGSTLPDLDVVYWVDEWTVYVLEMSQ